jgi:hypothetical protein
MSGAARSCRADRTNHDKKEACARQFDGEFVMIGIVRAITLVLAVPLLYVRPSDRTGFTVSAIVSIDPAGVLGQVIRST